MLSTSNSPLVAGTRPANAMANDTTRVTVLRPFLLKSERQEVGTELELDRRLAAELASYNKVQLVKPSDVAKAAIADMKPAEPRPARARKEPSNDGQ